MLKESLGDIEVSQNRIEEWKKVSGGKKKEGLRIFFLPPSGSSSIRSSWQWKWKEGLWIFWLEWELNEPLVQALQRRNAIWPRSVRWKEEGRMSRSWRQFGKFLRGVREDLGIKGLTKVDEMFCLWEMAEIEQRVRKSVPGILTWWERKLEPKKITGDKIGNFLPLLTVDGLTKPWFFQRNFYCSKTLGREQVAEL